MTSNDRFDSIVPTFRSPPNHFLCKKASGSFWAPRGPGVTHTAFDRDRCQALMNSTELSGSRKYGKYVMKASHGAILALLMTERLVICVTTFTISLTLEKAV